METNCSNIQVYTVPSDNSTPRDKTRTPINFTTSNVNDTKTVGFTIKSDYNKPIPGDQLVTFETSPSPTSKQNQEPFPTLLIATVLGATVVLVLMVAGLLIYSKKYKRKK